MKNLVPRALVAALSLGADNKPVVEPGDFDVMAGGLTQRLTVR
jgi:hypothetical protein